jgi:hypothetical protein
MLHKHINNTIMNMLHMDDDVLFWDHKKKTANKLSLGLPTMGATWVPQGYLATSLTYNAVDFVGNILERVPFLIQQYVCIC